MTACVACGDPGAVPVLDDAEDFEYRVPGRFRFVRCRACGLVYMSPRPSRAEILRFYPPDYHAYQRPEGRLFVALDRFNYRRRVDGYVRRLGIGRRVLDVAAATARSSPSSAAAATRTWPGSTSARSSVLWPRTSTSFAGRSRMRRGRGSGSTSW